MCINSILFCQVLFVPDHVGLLQYSSKISQFNQFSHHSSKAWVQVGVHVSIAGVIANAIERLRKDVMSSKYSREAAPRIRLPARPPPNKRNLT
jgi:hypothetical protein